MPPYLTTMVDSEYDEPRGSRKMAILVGLFASLGGIFFGYDQGVTSGVLVMDSFRHAFCVNESTTLAECTAPKLPTAWLNFTTLYNLLYNVGCVFGALLGGMIADRFGRRKTICLAGLLFCVGTLFVCIAPRGRHTTLLLSRLIQGLGTGNSSFSLPIFGAEVAPKELRGFLSGFMQMMIVTGILIANGVNLLVRHESDNGWRYANAVAIIPALVVMLGVFIIPESPRWVYLHRGMHKAERVLKRLRESDDVQRELDAIGDQVAHDGERESEWKELLHPSVFPRVVIAMLVQLLQQMTGINSVFTYGGLILKSVFQDSSLAVFFLSVVNFLSTIPAMWWVDSYGRRQMLLLGSIGMVLGHLAAGLAFTTGCSEDTAHASAECGSIARYCILVSNAFFVFSFAASWGPIGWIYPAEIFPLRLRAKAVSLSTLANWTMGAIMAASLQGVVLLTSGGLFFVFAILCIGCGSLVYYLCPETKGIMLEDVEEVFRRSTFDSKFSSAETPSLHAVY